MEPLVAWIISCESTNNMDRLFELATDPEPPASAFERQMCGLDGHEAQMAVAATLLRGVRATAGAGARAKKSKESEMASKAEAKRQRERAFGTTSRAPESPRAEEALASGVPCDPDRKRRKLFPSVDRGQKCGFCNHCLNPKLKQACVTRRNEMRLASMDASMDASRMAIRLNSVLGVAKASLESLARAQKIPP